MKTEVIPFGNGTQADSVGSLEQTLAAEVARLMSENAQLRTENADLQIDETTGLYTKKVFDKKVDKMLALAREHSKPVAYLFADGDGLKKINDTYGHDAGNEVIAHLAQVLHTNVRTYNSYSNYERRRGSLDGATDLVERVAISEDAVEIGRVGVGDEFGVVAYNVNLAQAEKIAARLHNALSATPYTTKNGQRIQLTMSIGIATTETATTREQLYKGADEALYAAKANGRNCTSIHRRTVEEAVPAPAHYQPAEVAA
jgi:GGDEF domain-containing protein